jgi:hypothetical protein
MTFTYYSVPQESYSRHLDNDVAFQEMPYGYEYKDDYLEKQVLVSMAESQDKALLSKKGIKRKK